MSKLRIVFGDSDAYKAVRYKVCMNDSLCQYVALPTFSRSRRYPRNLRHN